ncbi:SPOR domain-containing protein [Congregibacter brevis]|uniref:SPOR domain-containing protein n=1 Tax=Congregibacter brevis TaxID=3081201 RepID=A0ABZ0IHG3_9GAMM|nr:SPOR domain-containing protein [Congregibacter sp. IMCC45268]
MAEEDEDREIGNSAGDDSPRRGGDSDDQQDDYPSMFVDRDDDNSSPFVDRDYGDDLPDSKDDCESADPGYAAFASELDDPLADWPSPDVPLEELPEVRQQKESAELRAEVPEPVAQAPLISDLPEPLETPSDEAFLSSSTEPVSGDVNGDMLFEAAAEEVANSNAPDVSDGDDLAPEEGFKNGLSGVEDYGVPDSVPGDEEPNVPEAPSVDEMAEEAPFYDEEPLEPEVPEVGDDEDYIEESLVGQKEAFSEEQEDFEEEFVDDFLNDLDPPEEEELPVVDAYEDDFDTSIGVGTTMAESSVEKAGPFDTAEDTSLNTTTMHADDEEAPVPAIPASGNVEEKEDRSLPLGMLAVVAVALLLLAVGGFGVMQQRSEMQAEIRDLQAKLATTVSPEEAETERERQRQMQLQNESLSTELEALTAENDALSQRLEELESLEAAKASAAAEKLAQEAAAKAAADRAAQLAAEQAAAKKSAASRSASSGNAVAPKGPWFVNFGSYADRGIAERWANKLTVESGSVVVQTATAAGKTLYRVRVIGLADQDSAERVATALERQYQLPRLWVGKN